MATPNNKKPAPAAKPVNAAKPGQPVNGKSAAAPTPAKTEAPKEAPKDVDIDDLDDDVDTDSGSDGGDNFNKLPPAKRVAVRLGNEVNRLQKQFDTVSKWPEHGDSNTVNTVKLNVETALVALKKACEALTSLPDDYRPRVAKAGKAGGGKAELKAGDIIRITDKRVSEYEGVLEPEQMKGIKVVEIRGNKVIATTNDGVRAMFARGHVCLDDSAQPSA